eukprot:6716947-Pyramimonas_sp.AAC.1
MASLDTAGITQPLAYLRHWSMMLKAMCFLEKNRSHADPSLHRPGTPRGGLAEVPRRSHARACPSRGG